MAAVAPPASALLQALIQDTATEEDLRRVDEHPEVLLDALAHWGDVQLAARLLVHRHGREVARDLARLLEQLGQLRMQQFQHAHHALLVRGRRRPGAGELVLSPPTMLELR